MNELLIKEKSTAECQLELEEQLRFESLLNDISARFVNISADRVHTAIEDTQRMLCEQLDLDRSSLFQCSEEAPSTLLLTHVYQRPGLPFPIEKRVDPDSQVESYWRLAAPHSPGPYLKVDAQQMYPWFYAKARRGETSVVPNVPGMGEEAAQDRDVLASFGTLSTVVVPLSMGGEWLGILTFGSVRRQREWPDNVVKRFQFLASIYTNALARAKADASLRESEERYRKLFEAESDAILVADAATGQILDINAAAEAMYGHMRQEFLRLRDGDLYFQAKRPASPAPLSERPHFTSWHWRSNGQVFPVEISQNSLEYRGRKARVLAIRDISDRNAAQKRLEASELKFRQLAETIREVFYVCDVRNARLEYVSPTYEELTGRSREIVLENLSSFLEAVHPEDREDVRQKAILASSGEIISHEYRIVRPDGSIRWVWDRAFPILDAGVSRVTGLSEDITERKLAEGLLRESEARFRTVADCAPVLIWMSGPDKLCTFFNQTWLEFTGRTLEQELGNGWAECVHPEDRPACLKTYVESFDSRKTFTMEYRHRCHDGQYRWLFDKGVPRYDATGVFAGYIGSCVDITESKLANAALQKSWAEIKELKDRLQAETEYLRGEITVTHSFGELIGQSPAVRKVLHMVEQVAAADCPVLIMGETGTGKELVAHAIHRLSPRKDRSMVKVNCAALPSALIESELFGRERGAFTGATTTQAGRFEIADGSTLFLDEIGELSMEVQAKLLRVLQEGEFERLGSPRVRKVNVRVLAATNRDLAEEVRQHRFRQDLFYRLSVFPIVVPPLRSRPEDIPALVGAFVTEFASRMNKKITRLPQRTMLMLQQYSWPGNIRQLRNVIEHAVILSSHDVLHVAPLTDLDQPQTGPPHAEAPVSLADNEREHILKIFEKTGGRIKGPRGAAKILGLHPATLYSRMRKLGITNRPQNR